MTAAEIGAVLEADMRTAVLAGAGPTSANGATIRARLLTAYADAMVAITTPWLTVGTGITSGYLSFTESVHHAWVTNYQVRVRAVGSATVVASQDLGQPVADRYGVITTNLNTLFSGLGAGSYTLTILTTVPGGSSESSLSAAFTLPL